MIQIVPTTNYAGVTIAGDFYDFDSLYDSLHAIATEEKGYESVRVRVLGICYDMRKANMGNRGYEYKNNGLDRDQMKWMGIAGSDKNIYFSFKVFYPELLFLVMALNDFIEIYENKNSAHRLWDRNITTVRQFQSLVMDSLSSILKPQTFKLMQNNMSKKYGPDFSYFYTAYLDALNIDFLHWDKEKRLKNISIIAKRLAEQGKPYQEAVAFIHEAARESNCHPSEISYGYDYPDEEEIDW